MKGRSVKRPDDLRKLPLVEVTWKDACGNSRWMSYSEAKECETLETKTLGRLVHRGARKLVVCGTIADNGTVNDTTTIPRGWVTKVRRLKERSR